MHLLQALGYTLLTKTEAERERRGRLSNVFPEDILAAQLRRINRIRFRGRCPSPKAISSAPSRS
ncbi:MAG: hypothetical protein ACREFO_04870 [Acetobacteraceae bacterium]